MSQVLKYAFDHINRKGAENFVNGLKGLVWICKFLLFQLSFSLTKKKKPDGQMFGLFRGWGVLLSLKPGRTLETTSTVWTFALSKCAGVHGLRPPETFV
jgi:hypothetical protein